MANYRISFKHNPQVQIVLWKEPKGKVDPVAMIIAAAKEGNKQAINMIRNAKNNQLGANDLMYKKIVA